MRHSRSVSKATSNFFQIIITLCDKKTSIDLAIRLLSFQITQYCADYGSSYTLSASRRLIQKYRLYGVWDNDNRFFDETDKVPKTGLLYLCAFSFRFGQLIFWTITCRRTEGPRDLISSAAIFLLLTRIHSGAVKYKLFRFCPRLETWINVLSISLIHYATDCMEYTFLSFFGWTRRYMGDIAA